MYQSQPFEVNLLQEGAIDQGGPYRDTLIQVVTDSQGDKSPLGLFISPPSPLDHKEVFVPNCLLRSSLYCKHYQFVGQLLGMCLCTGDTIPFLLAPIVWKWLVQEELSQSDHEMVSFSSCSVTVLTFITQLDPNMLQTKLLIKCLTSEGAEAETPLVYFVSEDETDAELVPGGSDVAVTRENLNDYLHLLRQHNLKKIQPQMQSLSEGFLQIVSSAAAPLLLAVELQERIAGRQDINVDYLRQHTIYEGLTEDSCIAKYFWEALRSFTNEQRSLFLRFVWGRSTLPPSPEEFTEKFCISLMRRSEDLGEDLSEDRVLPHAHTCGFQIELPQYSSEKIMREKLLYAITNCHDIDLEWQANTDR